MLHPKLFKIVPNPNLFDFARCERSQDAFLCWLLCRAHHEYAGADEPLHRVGKALLNRFISLCGLDPPHVYDDVEIWTQYKGIDILALVNRSIVLLIEDKVDACEHADQLRRYPEVIQHDFPGYKIAKVYLKTGLPAEDEEASVQGSGFQFFRCGDLLAVLEEGEKFGVANDIYSEFLTHLRALEREVTDKAKRARGPQRQKTEPDDDGTCLFRLSASD